MADFAAIPTTYRDVRYRSRLEARWAAFFDLIGWSADYEPFDLNSWIPDFIINGADCPVVVEVKPIDNVRDPLFKESTFKIERSGWNSDALVLGRSLVKARTLSVGWLGQYFKEDRSWCWDVAPFQVVGDGCKAIAGFCHETQSYCDRISGCSPGGQTGVDFDTEARLLRLWKSAGNVVQWRSS